MAIDFPTSPSVNDTLTVGNVIYTWDGTKWTAVAAGGGGATDKIEEGNTSAEVIDTGSDGRFVVTTEGTERLRVNSAGEIGLAGANYGTSGQVLTSGGTGAAPTWSTPAAADKISEGNTEAEVVDTGSDGHFKVTTEGTERLRVTSTGEVGIGTTSANELVELRKDQDTNTRLRITNASDTASATAGIHLAPYGGNWYIEALRSSTFANPLRFTFDGSEKARLTYDGKLLVGTNTAATGTNTQYSLVQIVGNSAGGANFGALNILRNEDSANITLDENIGQIEFGDRQAGEYARIRVAADGNAGSGDYPGRLMFSTTADGASSPTERMRINNSGQILIGKASDTLSTAGWAIDGGSTIGRGQLTCGSSGAPILRLNHTGGAATEYVVESWKNGTQVGSISVTASATAYNTSSDYRLKENVVPLTGAIDRLQQIPVHRFNFIADPDQTVDGFLAHEAQAVVPECVVGTKDEVDADGNPVYQGIDQSKLVPLLTAALQEAIGEIASLKDRVTALEAQ